MNLLLIFPASIIMDEIIACLKKKKLLETKIIELLITPQLRTLDFSSMCEDNEVSGLLRLVTIKSPVCFSCFFLNCIINIY